MCVRANFQTFDSLIKGAGSGMAGMAAAIPIKNIAVHLFIICNKSRIKTLLFYMFLSHEFLAVTEVAKIQSTRTGLK